MGYKNVKELKDFMESSLVDSALSGRKDITRLVIKLDDGLSPENLNGISHANFMFRSFWINPRNSSSDFDVTIKLNPKRSINDLFSLAPNMAMDFEMIIEGATFEAPAQAGKQIEIVFSSLWPLNIGNIKQEISGFFSQRDGKSYDHDNISISSTPSLIALSNENRGEMRIFNNSGATIYVGKDTQLAHAEYQKKCPAVASGTSYRWRNPSALWVRTITGTTDNVMWFEETN